MTYTVPSASDEYKPVIANLLNGFTCDAFRQGGDISIPAELGGLCAQLETLYRQMAEPVASKKIEDFQVTYRDQGVSQVQTLLASWKPLLDAYSRCGGGLGFPSPAPFTDPLGFQPQYRQPQEAIDVS